MRDGHSATLALFNTFVLKMSSAHIFKQLIMEANILNLGQTKGAVSSGSLLFAL